jgi:hypothetical protein
MNYSGIYEALIRKAVKRQFVRSGYFETHHIIPRSLDGDDNSSNLVQLTYREHFLAHWLLTKLFVGIAKRKMTFAFFCMGMPGKNNRRIIASWQFEIIKRHCREQRLATQKQRLSYLRGLQIENRRKFIARAKAVIEKTKTKDATAKDIFEFGSLIDKAIPQVTIVKGRHYHSGDKVLMSVLEERGVVTNMKEKLTELKHTKKIKKSRLTHDARLMAWKEKRLGTKV